ncbi:MAG TPA: site-2 protease family protein [Candidatus Paceibacterota bacterium]|nr:site-2 protease family protein [Candidatus Paceibacterota bacterium]
MTPLLFGAFEIVILVYSVVLHELAHGYAARAMGDDTAERMGRLTLNPFAHLDWFGSLVLPLLTWILGGFMFGYAKPVPYDPSKLNDRRWGPAKVGLAGPTMNLAIALVFTAVFRLSGTALNTTAAMLVVYIISINVVLALFNLLPIPPLDGHWLLFALLPRGAYYMRAQLYRYQWFLVILAVFVIFPLLLPLVSAILRLLTGTSIF